MALWQCHIYHCYLFIYLFIIERCTKGQLVTQWAKNLKSLGDKFSSVVVLKDVLQQYVNTSAYVSLDSSSRQR